jgi:murein DD-endopeptidase MepM/ murein hydrolase activator NlpD
VLLLILTSVGYATVLNSPFGNERAVFAAPVSGLSMPAAAASVAPAQQAMLQGGVTNKTLPGSPSIGIAPPVEQEATNNLSAFSGDPTATPTSQPIAEQEDAIGRAAADAPPPVLPLYQIYQAVEGDSVYSISDRFAIGPEYILANNAELAASGFLSVGQLVIIPAGNGVLHEVRFGETLSDIAARYDVDVSSITDFPSNAINDPDNLVETQVVFVPGANILPAAPFDDEPVAEEAPTATPEQPVDSTGGSTGGGFVQTGRSSGAGLVWPLGGPVSSPYGPGHPLGIDIDAFYLQGAAVAAATSGTVIFAGGNACCSYGLYVVIMSDSGIETLYAHLNSIYVSQGEYVSQGQALGVVGSTGYSTGTHLHFEVIDNGVRQNPLNYLP